MPIAPSVWLVGLTLAAVGPILIRIYVRRVDEQVRRRTSEFLAQAQAVEAEENDAPDEAK